MTGIILAGGKNLRMKRKKAFLKFGRRRLIELILNKLKPLFDEIIIVSSNNTERLFKKYESAKIRVIKDIVPEGGSLCGIYSGLTMSRSRYNFVCACDMPFLNIGLIKFMMKHAGRADVIIPRLSQRSLPNNGYEVLHAIYSKKCLPYIEMQLKAGDFKIINFFKKVNIKELNEKTVKMFDRDLHSFFNINTKEDYFKALKIFNTFKC